MTRNRTVVTFYVKDDVMQSKIGLTTNKTIETVKNKKAKKLRFSTLKLLEVSSFIQSTFAQY